MSRAALRAGLADSLQSFLDAGNVLPGLNTDARQGAFVEQLVDSERRNRYYARLLERNIGEGSADPHSPGFNPLAAAVWFDRLGDRDEAMWMVFLSVHFGRALTSRWLLVGDIYGRLDCETNWTWAATSNDVQAFRAWLHDNSDGIRALEPRRRFGNHRKYESLDAWTAAGTGAVVASYVEWVGATRSHDTRIGDILTESGEQPRDAFRALYRSVQGVHRFGRTAAFDYCSTVSKLGLAPIEPAMAALSGATGPLRGTRLLFGDMAEGMAPRDLEVMLEPLRDHLGIGFDALEDALCNWQKSPEDFMPFRG